MRKSYIIIAIFILFVTLITIVGCIIVTGNKSVKKVNDILIVQNNKEAYFNGYGYSIDNPNIIINPYGNSPLTAIVMFETSDYSEVFVSIKSKNGDADINYTFGKDKHHLVPIYGLYPNYNNTVVIKSEGIEKIINIETEDIPDDFEYASDMSYDNFMFYNNNYPYAVDINGDIRWYLNSNYYGNITMLDNANIIIGSDRYTEDGNTISFYEMNLLGKVCNEYLLAESYYGYNTFFDDKVVILSDKIISVDLQTGNIVSSYGDNDLYDYITSDDDNLIVGKQNIFYKIDKKGLNEYTFSNENHKYDFYNNSSNYKTFKGNRFGELTETNISNKNVSLIKYKKSKNLPFNMEIENNRMKIINNTEDKIYIVLDKFLDKRVYDVGYIKYINTTGLKGKYTIYYKSNGKVYKTDYYVEA